MRVLTLLLTLTLAGCAASNKVGGTVGERVPAVAPAHGVVGGSDLRLAPAAPADSLTLRWTLPTRGAIGCWADPASRVYDRQRWSVLRLKGQPPWYAPGMMDRPAGMDSIRAWTRPDTVASGWGWPGEQCAARVVRGPEYAVVARNSRGWNCWGRIVR